MIRTFAIALSAFTVLTLALGAQAQPRPAAPAGAASERMVAVGEVFPYLERFYGVPANLRTQFHLEYALRLNGQPYRGPAAYVSANGQHTPVPVGADGRIGRLPTLAQLRDRNERIAIIAAPNTHFTMNLGIVPNVRPAAEMDAGALAGSIAQSNAAIREAAGLMRFAAPTMTRVVFMDAPQGVAVMADGSTRPLPGSGGATSFTPETMPGARLIRLSRAPSSLQIAPARR